MQFTGITARLSRRRLLAGLAVPLVAAVCSRSVTHRDPDVAEPHFEAPPRARFDGSAFLLGANYEGPAEHAWAMWADGRFDPAAIGADFGRALAVGLRCLRVFVHAPLAGQIRRGEWHRLDSVVHLAQRVGLRLLITFADYPESQLAALARIAAAVAGRYAGQPAILAYDLRNEPRFGDLLTARYPRGLAPALAGPSLLESYGERVSVEAVVTARQAEPRWLPGRLGEEQGYWVANSLAIYDELEREAAHWMAASPGPTILDYLDQPEPGQRWAPFVAVLNDGLAAWLAAQVEPIRRADPYRPITVGYNDLLLAALPANGALDFISFHHYLPPDDAAPACMAQVLASLSGRLGQPAVLGEFGWATSEVAPERVGELETRTLYELRRRGLAGGLKWMLNDAPEAEDPREASFGLFRADGTPKPSALAWREAATA